jgi:hypothetical protein
MVVSILKNLFGSRSVEIPQLKLGVIGRENAGKTALFKTLYAGPMQIDLPSGLRLGVQDPRRMAELIRDSRETYRGLHERGLLSTVDPKEIEYHLLDLGRVRLGLQIREVIGQVLTRTMPQSPAQQQQLYADYLTDLATSDVLWMLLPCPPASSTEEDQERLYDDFLLSSAYAQAAMRQRGKPCAMAIVLSKLDSRYGTEDQARERVQNDVLGWLRRQASNCLLGLENLEELTIFPVSSFGFGRSVIKPHTDKERSSRSSEEAEWVLRGAGPRPFNLTPLVLWSLVAGLRHREVTVVGREERELAQLLWRLQTDLESLEGWYYTLGR